MGFAGTLFSKVSSLLFPKYINETTYTRKELAAYVISIIIFFLGCGAVLVIAVYYIERATITDIVPYSSDVYTSDYISYDCECSLKTLTGYEIFDTFNTPDDDYVTLQPTAMYYALHGSCYTEGSEDFSMVCEENIQGFDDDNTTLKCYDFFRIAFDLVFEQAYGSNSYSAIGISNDVNLKEYYTAETFMYLMEKLLDALYLDLYSMTVFGINYSVQDPAIYALFSSYYFSGSGFYSFLMKQVANVAYAVEGSPQYGNITAYYNEIYGGLKCDFISTGFNEQFYINACNPTTCTIIREEGMISWATRSLSFVATGFGILYSITGLIPSIIVFLVNVGASKPTTKLRSLSTPRSLEVSVLEAKS